MTDEEPLLGAYLRVTKTRHLLIEGRAHRDIAQVNGIYEAHGHVIRDTDSASDKNWLAGHIERFHRGDALDG